MTNHLTGIERTDIMHSYICRLAYRHVKARRDDILELGDYYHEGIAAYYAAIRQAEAERCAPNHGYLRTRIRGAMADLQRRFFGGRDSPHNRIRLAAVYVPAEREWWY
jgi:hypothetical protein